MFADQPLSIASISWPGIVLGIVLSCIVYVYNTAREKPYNGIPLVQISQDTRSWWRRCLEGPGNARDFMFNGPRVLEEGIKMTRGESPFQVKGGAGYRIILPNRFADELRSHPDLSFNDFTRKQIHADFYGFDGIREAVRDDRLMADLVQQRLTQCLNLVTDDLVDEAVHAMALQLGDEKAEWETHRFRDVLLDIVARVSTRVFAGKELARHPEWLHITKQYTVETMTASASIHQYPAPLRAIFQWFNPSCRQLRWQCKTARNIIEPMFARKLQERQALKEKRLDTNAKSLDAFNMMLDMAEHKGVVNYDAAAGQLMLSFAAIHTTTETLGRCLIRLCEYPDVQQPLREEIITVLKEEGWNKSAFPKLMLVDSFMKEVTRHFTMGVTAMGRSLRKQVVLSDGTVLPKDSLIMFHNDKLKDETTYSDPEKFDAWRHLKLRQRPGESNRHQFVTTSPNNLFFGHGKYACPGRFFGSNEIKILLCILLLRYDFRIEPGTKIPPHPLFETTMSLHPDFKLQARRRQEEINVVDPKKA